MLQCPKLLPQPRTTTEPRTPIAPRKNLKLNHFDFCSDSPLPFPSLTKSPTRLREQGKREAAKSKKTVVEKANVAPTFSKSGRLITRTRKWEE